MALNIITAEGFELCNALADLTARYPGTSAPFATFPDVDGVLPNHKFLSVPSANTAQFLRFRPAGNPFSLGTDYVTLNMAMWFKRDLLTSGNYYGPMLYDPSKTGVAGIMAGLSLNVSGAQITTRPVYNGAVTAYGLFPIPSEEWVHLEISFFYEDTSGFYKVWMNGEQVAYFALPTKVAINNVIPMHGYTGTGVYMIAPVESIVIAYSPDDIDARIGMAHVSKISPSEDVTAGPFKNETGSTPLWSSLTNTNTAQRDVGIYTEDDGSFEVGTINNIPLDKVVGNVYGVSVDSLVNTYGGTFQTRVNNVGVDDAATYGPAQLIPRVWLPSAGGSPWTKGSVDTVTLGGQATVYIPPVGETFQMIIQATSAGGQAFLITSGDVSVTIDWGDGVIEPLSGSKSHNYAVAGTYVVNIYGTSLDTLTVNNAASARLLEVIDWGNLNIRKIGLVNAPLLTKVPTWIPTSFRDIGGMFNNATAFNDPSVTSWDTRFITDMSGTFQNCPNFEQNISGWNVSNVTDFSYMFNGATKFNANIGGWDVSSAEANGMASMFQNASAFNQDLSDWCVTNILTKPANFDTNTGAWIKPDRQPVWGTCPVPANPHHFVANLETLAANEVLYVTVNNPISPIEVEWGDGTTDTFTSTQTISHTYTTASTFTFKVVSGSGAASFLIRGLPLKGIRQWGTIAFSQIRLSQVVAPSSTRLVSVPTSIPSHLTSLNQMFAGATAFNQDISSWNTSNVTDMGYMFWGASAFNKYIGGWDTSSVTVMMHMFSAATSFNQNLGYWSTGNVTSMSGMFENASVFNQDLSSWCVSNISIKPANFDTNTGAWIKPDRQPVWGTCPAPIVPMVIRATGGHSMGLYGSSLTGVVVDWGDGQVQSVPNGSRLSHTFAAGGEYEVRIRGKANSSFSISGSAITEVVDWGDFEFAGLSFLYSGFPSSRLVKVPDYLPTRMTNLNQLFYSCTAFNDPSIVGWHTGHVTTMAQMFQGASAFNQDLSGWCVTNIASMPGSFDTGTTAWVKTGRQPVWGTCPGEDEEP